MGHDLPIDEVDRDSDFVLSLERGLSVIQELAAPDAERTLSAVAAATGMSRAATRRFMITLVRLGYARADGKRFALTPKVLGLGYAFLSGLGLPELARPHLERLSRHLDQSCSVSVLDGFDIVYIARAASPTRAMSLTIRVGTRLPASPTSMGRVLLAGLSERDLAAFLQAVDLDPLTDSTVVDRTRLRSVIEAVRERGWALVDGEREAGLRSAACPIHGPRRAVVAAINVSVLAAGTTLETLENDLLPAVQRTARAIEADLVASASSDLMPVAFHAPTLTA